MIIGNESVLEKAVSSWARLPYVALDTETYAKDGGKKGALILDRARLYCVSVSTRKGKYVIPTDALEPGRPPARRIVRILAPLLTTRKTKKVFHNANYDINVFRNYGVVVRNYYCTMVAAAMKDENRSKGLKQWAPEVQMFLRKFSNPEKKNIKGFLDYAADDAEACRRLYEAFETGEFWNEGKRVRVPELRLKGSNRRVFEEMEMPILDYVIEAERRGILIDRDHFQRLEAKLEKKAKRHEWWAYKIAGRKFNLRSNHQLRNVLYNELKLPIVRMTKKGAPSSDVYALAELQDEHEIVHRIRAHREITKLLSTYIRAASGLPAYCDSEGRIHCTLTVMGAATGRFSSSAPNLQNIPSKQDKYGIRDGFIAGPGHVLLSADFSQIELRLAASFANEKRMLKVLRKPDGDLHQSTADALHIDRYKGKVANFGLTYQMGWKKLQMLLLQEGLKVSDEECMEYVSRFRETYPRIRDFVNVLQEEHSKHGYLRYIGGRVRRIPQLDSPFESVRSRGAIQAGNNVVQGSAADLIKAAMLRIRHDEVLKELKCVLLLQIHDELLFEVPESTAKQAAERVKELMSMLPDKLYRKVRVPLFVSVGTGRTWKAAKEAA